MSKIALKQLIALASVLSSLHFTVTARAQAIPDAVYNDVKEIISDVLEQDVAIEVAPHLACLAGRIRERNVGDAGAMPDAAIHVVPPNVAFGSEVYQLEAEKYFPRTLQRVYDGQYSTLKSTVMDEASQIVGDIVYHLLLRPRSGRALDLNDTGDRAVQAAIEQAGVLRHRPMSGEGHRISFEPLSDLELETCAAAVATQLQNHALAAVESPLSRECSLATGAPAKDGGAVRANEYACDLALGVADTVHGDKAAAEGALERALAELLAEATLAATPTASQLNATATILQSLLTANTSLGDGGVSRADILATTEADLLTALGPEAAEPLTVAAREGASRPRALRASASTLLPKLYYQWKSIQPNGGGAVTVAKFLDGLAMLASDIRPLCASAPALETAPACKVLTNEQAAITVTNDVFPILDLASKGDVGSAVQLAVNELFEGASARCLTSGGAEKGCALLPVYRDMTDAIITYVIEADGGKAPSSATRATLISTGSRFIVELGKGGGMDRPILPHKGSLWTFLYPDLELRYSFSPSYAFAGTSASRMTASLPVLNFRTQIYRRQLVYVGAEFSLLDPLAPLAEMVGSPSQSTVVYKNQDRLAINVVTPRADFNVGVPALAKNLVVGAGASLRLVAPWYSAAATATLQTTYEYDFCWNKTFANCLEFGFFAKYVM